MNGKQLVFIRLTAMFFLILIHISSDVHASVFEHSIKNNSNLLSDTSRNHQEINHIKISARYQAGFIGDPEYNFQHIIKGYPTGLNIDISKQFTLQTNINHSMGTFRKGLNFYRVNLANPEVLGSVMAITPYLEYALFPNQFISPALRIGMGLAYVNKPHHRIDNYKNTLIGSHFNVSLSSKFLININITNNLALQGGLSVIHISNGNTISPNDGINLFNLESGISYSLYGNKDPMTSKHALMSNKKDHIYLTGMASLTNFQQEVQTGFNYYTFMAEWVHQINPFFGLGLGMDFTHNNANADKVTFDPILPAVSNQVGIKGIAQVPLNNLNIMLQVGVINIDKYRMYNWLVLRHTIYKDLYFNLSYRAYGFTEGHLGWGLGIKL